MNKTIRLKNNYFNSNKRLETCVIRKLDEPNLVVIDKIYASYLEMGIVKEINDKTSWLGDAVYLPTLIVHQPKSETTPVQPCCYGKAKHINGKSINELLFLAGPNRMCTLTKVLTRFRQYDVAFTGDIPKNLGSGGV
jgi:acetylglutamate kinase